MNAQGAYFDKTMTNVLKGFALLMMFFHHFFTFPSWWSAAVWYPLLAALAPYIREPFRMCVPVFCFLTGYFYYFNPHKNYRYAFKKITDILLSYWGVFLVFALAAVFCVGYRYSVSAVIREMLALSVPTMSFCWYVSFYCISMLLLPVCARLLSGNAVLDCVLCFALVPCAYMICLFVPYVTVQQQLIYIAMYFPCILSGYLFACYRWFERLETINLSKGLNIVLWVIFAVAACLCRQAGPAVSPRFSSPLISYITPVFTVYLDVVCAPVFVYCVVNLHRHLRTRVTEAVLTRVGEYSLLMWFVSCIFFNNSYEVFEPILYLPRNPVLVMIWGVFLCFMMSLAFDFVLKRVRDAKNRVFFP